MNEDQSFRTDADIYAAMTMGGGVGDCFNLSKTGEEKVRALLWSDPNLDGAGGKDFETFIGYLNHLLNSYDQFLFDSRIYDAGEDKRYHANKLVLIEADQLSSAIGDVCKQLNLLKWADDTIEVPVTSPTPDAWRIRLPQLIARLQDFSDFTVLQERHSLWDVTNRMAIARLTNCIDALIDTLNNTTRPIRHVLHLQFVDVSKPVSQIPPKSYSDLYGLLQYVSSVVQGLSSVCASRKGRPPDFETLIIDRIVYLFSAIFKKAPTRRNVRSAQTGEDQNREGGPFLEMVQFVINEVRVKNGVKHRVLQNQCASAIKRALASDQSK